MPTRVTHNTETLLDHVYVTPPHKVIEVLVPKIGLSDHLTTCIMYSRCKRDKLKKGHVSVKYRDIKILIFPCSSMICLSLYITSIY